MEFLKLWEIVVRRKWLMIITFFIFLAAVVVGTYLATPIYEAKAKLLVEPSASLSSLMSNLGLPTSMASRQPASAEAYETEIALAQLRPLIEKLISALDLKDKDGEPMKPDDIIDPSILNTIFPEPSLEVARYEESDLLEIISSSKSPAEAAAMSNELARLYIEDRLEQTRDEYKTARAFIENRIAEIKEKYYASLIVKRDFMIEEETVDLNTESTSLLARISSLKNDLRASEIALAQAEQSVVLLQEKLGEGEYSSSALIDQLETRLSDLLVELAGKTVHYTLKDPDVAALNQQIDTLRGMLKDRAQIVLGEKEMSIAPVYGQLMVNLKDAYINKKIEEIRIGLLKRFVDTAKDELIEIPSKIIESAKLELSLTNYQSVYANLLQYLTEVGIAESMTISNIRLVEPAIEPDADKPKFPKDILNYIVGVFLGLFLAFSLALFMEYIDNTIKNPADLEGFGFTFLGSIPGFRRFRRKRLISKTDSNDPVYEAYRKVLSNIHFARLGKPPKKLLVTSVDPKAGSSTVVVNLGTLCAKEGRTTLLIDTDLRRPHLHRLTGCSNEEGLTSVLLDNKEIESVVYKSRIDGLSILPAGPTPSDPGLLLKSDKIRKVIAQLGEEYDVLIFDSAPLLIKSDAIILKSYADDMVLISRNKSTTSHAISQVAGFLKNAQMTPIGIILNCL